MFSILRKEKVSMKHISLIFFSLALALTLSGCKKEPPTFSIHSKEGIISSYARYGNKQYITFSSNRISKYVSVFESPLYEYSGPDTLNDSNINEKVTYSIKICQTNCTQDYPPVILSFKKSSLF